MAAEDEGFGRKGAVAAGGVDEEAVAAHRGLRLYGIAITTQSKIEVWIYLTMAHSRFWLFFVLKAIQYVFQYYDYYTSLVVYTVLE